MLSIILLELSDRTLERQGRNSGQIWKLLTDNGYRIYGFDKKTGAPVPAERKPYFNSEDVVVIYSILEEQVPW